jgi:predicted nucleotidyltransferase
MLTLLEKQILATLSYYDLFDYPLTAFELWRYLIREKISALSEGAAERGKSEISVGAVFKSLDDSTYLRELIGESRGFYFFAGHDSIVDARLRRKKLADRKWKRLRRIFRLLAALPFVRAIFVSGSLSMENSKEDSDVDIIVVAATGRIWTVRTLLTFFTYVLGVRRYGSKTRDRICLNHYITDASLRIPFPSLYNAESYAHLVNVYLEDAALFRRFQEENVWIQEYVAQLTVSELDSTRSCGRSRLLSHLARMQEFLLRGRAGDVLEKTFARIEGNRIRRDRLYAKRGGRITIDDTQLEFHPDSHEFRIIPEFNRRMSALGLSEFAGQADSGLNK